MNTISKIFAAVLATTAVCMAFTGCGKKYEVIPGAIQICADQTEGITHDYERSEFVAGAYDEEDKTAKKNISIDYFGDVINVEYYSTYKPKYSHMTCDVYMVPGTLVCYLIDRKTGKVVGTRGEKGIDYGNLERPDAGEDVAKECAVKYISGLCDVSHYKKSSIGKTEYGYRMEFYNEMGGLKVGDSAEVSMLKDGTVYLGYALPDNSIDVLEDIEIDLEQIDARVREKVNNTYELINTCKYNVKNCKISDYGITRNEDGGYMIICYCDVSLEALSEHDALGNHNELIYVTVNFDIK